MHNNQLLYLFIFSQEAECRREMMDVKFKADTKMADSKRELDLQKASFNQEVNTKVKYETSESQTCARFREVCDESYALPFPESGGPAGVRAAGGQGAAEDPLGGDRDPSGAEEEGDHHRGERDRSDGEGAHCHDKEARRGGGLQSAAAG